MNVYSNLIQIPNYELNGTYLTLYINPFLYIKHNFWKYEKTNLEYFTEFHFVKYYTTHEIVHKSLDWFDDEGIDANIYK